TEMEIDPLISELHFQNESENQLRYYSLGGLTIHVLITGVGMTSTAFQMGRVMGRSTYSCALNAGLAGSFNRNLDLGAVVHITDDCFSELGAEDGDRFVPIGEMGLGAVQKVTSECQFPANPALELIPRVNGITVNTVHGNDKSISEIFDRCHPVTESMEGAAFLMACAGAGIPGAQIRAVSNYVERRNREAWNIPLAIRNLNKTILDILRAFS
ncbi:MAG TPA: futalosine hydrolase, partial [Bacteroidia bacterium]|nr:futalosine hydrolase [Bacteroidia bacterium]